jgi:hypothetical protein
MPRSILFALLLLLQPVATRADDLRHMADFHNVWSKDGGEHCSGYSLRLWKLGDRVLGLLDVHAGLCGDPPCGVVRDAKLDSRTGRLEFWSSINGEKIRFEGNVTAETVDGVLDAEHVRLARGRDRTSDDFEPNRSILAWCRFWISVPRCDGVREFCESIHVLGIKRGAHSAPEPTATSGRRLLALPSSLRSSAAAQRERWA